MTENRKQKGILLLTLIFLIGALGIIQYYIWGNAYLTEFQADCTDTLFWANSTLESGALFKDDFVYAYRLVFGGQWLFMPFIKLFGIGMLSLRCGMCLFSLILTAALVFFSRSIGWSRTSVFFDSGLMLLAVCATKKTREIFFGHVIHYSLSVLYLLIACAFLFRFLSRDTRRKKILPALLFTLTLLFCSANGSVQILYVTVPLLGGLLLEFCLNGDRSLLALMAGTILAAGAGFLYSRTLNTNYTDSYSVLVTADDWTINAGSFLKRWISLFFSLPGKNLDAFSATGIKTIFKMIVALLTIVGAFLGFSRGKDRGTQAERIFIYTTLTMWVAFLFFFFFGKVSDVDWRLIPLVFSAQIVILILITMKDLPKKQTDVTLTSLLTLVCGIMFAAHALSNAAAVLRIPYDTKVWYAENGLIETLKAHDLNYGYITNYWLSNNVTVLTDEEIRLRYVMLTDAVPEIFLFNSDAEWYDDQPGQEKYFLVMRSTEYDPEMTLAQDALEVYTCHQEEKRNGTDDDYVILVYDHNIMSRK